MSPWMTSSPSSPSANCWRCRRRRRWRCNSTALILLTTAASCWMASAASFIAVPLLSLSPSSASCGDAGAAQIILAPLFAASRSDDIDDHSADNNKKLKINTEAPPAERMKEAGRQLTLADIEWKLLPPPPDEQKSSRRLLSLTRRLKIKSSGYILRLYSKLSGKELPPVLCPKGGRAVLEAYYREPTPGKGEGIRRMFWKKKKGKKMKIGRFGFTTLRGPSNDEIDATIREIYKINPPPLSATIAAVIYMYVEPQYRHRNVGSLALSVISAIQAVQAVDFTVLVATGDEERLVGWYERNGYTKAPLLQSVMGSPDGEFGITMIAPVQVEKGFFDECKLKWW